MADPGADPASTSWREIVASSLAWEQAHISLERALEDLPPELRGRRPHGAPYSIWQLVEHIRIAQRDLLDLSQPITPRITWARSRSSGR